MRDVGNLAIAKMMCNVGSVGSVGSEGSVSYISVDCDGVHGLSTSPNIVEVTHAACDHF